MGNADVDVDVVESFSTFASERLSGIIGLSLVSIVNDKRVEVIEEGRPPSNSSQTWVEIMNGDFEHELGIFHAYVSADAFVHVAYYLSVKRRWEIIHLHNQRENGNAAGSSVSIDNIAASKKVLRLVFSYYANSI